MSKTTKHAMCERKKRFDRESHALNAGALRFLRPYKCPYCSGWHLTGQIFPRTDYDRYVGPT